MTVSKSLKYFKDFGALLYPRNCVACGSDGLETDQLICWACISQLPLTNFEKQPDNMVAELFTGRMPVQMATAFLFFGKESLVQHLIHRFKYKANLDLGVLLGKMMGKAMLEAGWQDAIDVIVPLPLNKKKQAKRGFNQAEILAKGIGEAMNKPVEPVAVIRSKFTETQTRKSREDINNAFYDAVEILPTNPITRSICTCCRNWVRKARITRRWNTPAPVWRRWRLMTA